MSKFDDLLTEFCPSGIEYKSLGTLEDEGIVTLGRGNIISKKEMVSNPGDYPVYSSSATGDGEIGRYGKYMFDDERITWSIDGGGKLFYRNNLKYSVTNVGGHIKILSEKWSTKYLYYVLLYQWKGKKFDYVKKAHPSVIRDEYLIPCLPFELQKEIVARLDTFETLISKLQEELEERKKQFEYYKNQMMVEGNNSRQVVLSEVCEIIDCPHTSPKWETSGVPVIRNYNLVNGHIDMSDLSYVSEDEYIIRTKRVTPRKDDILFSREAPIGNVGIVPEGFRCCQGQRVVLLRPNTSLISPRYLLHVLQSDVVKAQINKVEQVGSTVSNFNISDLKKLNFFMPDMPAQNEIIEKLDVFQDLCASPNKGIMAEISLRRKQMDYYEQQMLDQKLKAVT